MDLQTTEVLKSIHAHAVWLLESHGVEVNDKLEAKRAEEKGGAKEDWFEANDRVAHAAKRKGALERAKQVRNGRD